MKNKWLKRIAASIALVLLLVMATACSKGGEKEADQPKESMSTTSQETPTKNGKDSLVFVAREINSTLDPTKPHSDGYLRRAGAIEALFHVESNGEVVPWLAKEGKMIDAKKWEIALRENATFWSGKPVTAEVTVRALERARANNVKSEAALKGFTFTAKGDYLIEVATEQENVDLPLSLTEIAIVNPDLDYTSVEQSDMTGMYKVVEFLPKQRLTLTRNENYWGEKPKIKEVLFEEIYDDDARLTAALSGRADIVGDVPVAGAKQIKDSKDMDLLNSNPSGTLSVYLNMQKSPWDDVKVRQALCWGTDRQELVDIHTEGMGMAVPTWLSSNPLYADKIKSKGYDQYDLEKAKALLDSAGWTEAEDGIRKKDGKPLGFKLMTWGSEKVLGELLQNQWKKLGVEVDLHHVDYSVIEQARETGEWDGLVETWTHYGYMYSILSNHFGPGGSINYGKYDGAEFNQLLEELHHAGDPEKQHELVLRMNDIITEEALLVPMLPRPTVIALKKGLKGFEPHFIQYQNYINNRLVFSEE